MKVLVYFQPSPKHDNFEGARMRKTIKGALEVIGQTYTSNLYDDYDVAHFMSPTDENKLNIVLERKVPIVISALFGEDDPSTRFLDHKVKKGETIITLKPRAIKVLNKASLILVPCKSAKDLLIKLGINKPIEILVPGVNLARFNFSREDEKELFYRYFREEKNKKIVLAMGEYTNNMEGINSLINAAKKKEDALFYYIGCETFAANYGNCKKIIKNAPKNVHFKTILPDDIYRSLLLNADVFMLTGCNLSGFVSIEEAMAANCQLIVRESAIFPELLVNEKTAYITDSSEKLTSLCVDYLDGKINSTTQAAYQEISEFNLNVFGQGLLNVYNSLTAKK